MKVYPNRIAQALAGIYGQTTPRRFTSLLHVPCPKCNGAGGGMLTQCPKCNGFGRVMEIG